MVEVLDWLLLVANRALIKEWLLDHHIVATVSVCSDRILTCRIKSIRSPAKVGLVVTDLITSPVVSWEGWETPPPQHRGSAVILCSTTGVGRPLSPVVTCCCRLLDFCLRLVDVDWNTVSFC